MDSPEITAHFELSTAGEPEAVERGGLKHYRIGIKVRGAPEDTYAVTYILHPSYRDPVRESTERGEGFGAHVTSFGDYTVQAKIRTKSGVLNVAAGLSKALNAGHQDQMNPAIEQALLELSSR